MRMGTCPGKKCIVPGYPFLTAMLFQVFDEKQRDICYISHEGFPTDMPGLHSSRGRLTQRRVLGTCALGKSVGLDSLVACARTVVGMCALENAWGTLRSPPALEGCLVWCV